MHIKVTEILAPYYLDINAGSLLLGEAAYLRMNCKRIEMLELTSLDQEARACMLSGEDGSALLSR